MCWHFNYKVRISVLTLCIDVATMHSGVVTACVLVYMLILSQSRVVTMGSYFAVVVGVYYAHWCC